MKHLCALRRVGVDLCPLWHRKLFSLFFLVRIVTNVITFFLLLELLIKWFLFLERNESIFWLELSLVKMWSWSFLCFGTKEGPWFLLRFQLGCHLAFALVFSLTNFSHELACFIIRFKWVFCCVPVGYQLDYIRIRVGFYWAQILL